MTADHRRVLAHLERLALRAPSRAELFDEAAERLKRAVPFDGACWHTLDPTSTASKTFPTASRCSPTTSTRSATLFFGEHLPRIQERVAIGEDASFVDAPRPRDR
jgi:hypothetical protein